MIGGSERWCTHVPPVPSGMMPIAAPDRISPKVGHFSTMRYGLAIVLGHSGAAWPRPAPLPPGGPGAPPRAPGAGGAAGAWAAAIATARIDSSAAAGSTSLTDRARVITSSLEVPRAPGSEFIDLRVLRACRKGLRGLHKRFVYFAGTASC